MDFRGDIALGQGTFSRLKLRGGYSDYTRNSRAMKLVQCSTRKLLRLARAVQSSGGVIGTQFTSRDFSAVGAEAFVAPHDTTQIAIFTAQEFSLDNFQIEAAARYEKVDVETTIESIERNFDLFSRRHCPSYILLMAELV